MTFGRLTATGLALVATAVLAGPVYAGKRPEPPNLVPLLSGGTPDALAGSLRGYLVRALPDPLYESSPGWGQTRRAVKGVKWTGELLPLRPEVMRGPKNHGVWQHVRVAPVAPADTLVLDVRDVQVPEPGRMTFTVFMALDARLDYTRQRWETGVKLFDASARARFRLKVTLACEATTRWESGAWLLPDAVFRLRVTLARVGYDNFVVEHIAGVGGEAAKLFGDAVKGGMEQWHPSLERNLQEKANAALVKAGETREVRLGVSQLFKKQGGAGGGKNGLAPPPKP